MFAMKFKVNSFFHFVPYCSRRNSEINGDKQIASETFRSQWRRIRLKGLTKYTIIMTEAYQGDIKH